MLSRTLVLSALAACAAAQSKVLFFTHVPNPITDGQPAAITYSTNDTNSPVTIILRQGQTSNLNTIMTLTDSSYNSQYIWTPPKSLPNGVDYALEIKQGTQVNYYGPFVIQGASPGAVASASSASAASASKNATMTTSNTASSGTSATMHSNSTMSSANLTTTKTTATTATTNTMASTSGAGFQGTTTGSSQPSNTNGASSDFVERSGSLALVFGAMAAVFYLY